MSDLQDPFIVGDLCYLRALKESDLDGPYLSWLNDFEVTRYLEVGRTPSTPETLRAFFDDLQKSSDRILLAICDKSDNRHIGNISLRGIHPVHRRADLGIVIGDKDTWGKGYGTEATFLMVDFGFRRWNLHSIYLGVLTSNKAAIRAYEKCGFSIDGTDREAWWADGEFHDVHRMSILAREHFARLNEK